MTEYFKYQPFKMYGPYTAKGEPIEGKRTIEAWNRWMELDLKTRCEHVLADMQRQFEDGDETALLEAVTFCLEYPGPAPKWVQDNWRAGWGRWKGAEVRTLDEAYNIQRRPDWRRRRARKDVLVHVIWQRTLENCRRENKEPTESTFRDVAQDLTREGKEDPSSPFFGLSVHHKDVRFAWKAHEREKKS